MSSGVIRRIDELGRIVIPKEIRKSLNLINGDYLDISLHDKKICLEKYNSLSCLEEELFNIAKIINENTGSTILISDNDSFFICYGKNSEQYYDKKINNNLKNKVEGEFYKGKDLYLSSSLIESRTFYYFPLIISDSIIGSIIILENEKNVDNNNLDIIKAFKKLINKQLEFF